MAAENRPGRSHVDDVLDLVDHALQRSTEPSMYMVGDGACWRCQCDAPDGPAGLCPECRTVLLDEAYTTPTNWWELPGPIPTWPVDAVVFSPSFVAVRRPPGWQIAAAAFADLHRNARLLSERCVVITLEIDEINRGLLDTLLGIRGATPVPAKAAHRRRFGR